MLEFESINLEKQPAYLQRLSECPQKSSDYSFVNIWGWAQEYGLSWAWKDNLVWIKQTKPQVLYWAPVGPWQDIDFNQMFLANLTHEFTIANREQDLDDEGLRKAKLSYNPVDFLRKYKVTIS